MSVAERKAVFISYASQDAEAARRICEALRTAGVEVWFDQSELRGGDAWDAKIRKQIKECALFVPIISANTQARTEGYFRLEWRLADQRTHLMAKGRPFLLPAVIDGTRDSEAHVPDSFLEVQWTALPRGETADGFCTRVAALLDRSAAAPNPASSDQLGRIGRAPARRSRAGRWVAAVMAFAFIAGGAVWWRTNRTPAPAPSESLATADPLTELTTRFAALLRNSREDVALAETLTERETIDHPQSSDAWARRAFVQSVYLIRGWDSGPKRRQDAQAFARRALSIDKDDTRAMFVLATVFTQQGAFDEAEAILRRALLVKPDSKPLKNSLAIAFSGQGKTEEGIVMLEQAVERGDVRSNYNLGLLHECKEVPDFEAALRCFEVAITAPPSTNILLHKAALLAGGRGDLAGARSTLERVSPVDRIEDRVVGTAMTFALFERQPDRVLAAGRQTARDYFEDLYVPGPKAWRLAHAHRLAGKESLANAEWQSAESVLRRRLATSPENTVDTAALAVTLAWLGRSDEAARLIAPIEANVREAPPRVVGWAPDHLRLLYLGYYYAGLGDASRAVPYVRRLVNRRELLTDHTLPLDPWWDRIRGRPEFEALLVEGTARRERAQTIASAGNPPAEKSVAVLAFENLSDDKANEYFSDGLSEELIDRLGRVPGLTVKGSTSAFYFKGNKQVLPAEIGRQLGVAYLVRGSVRKDGNKVLIAARLTQAADDRLIWSLEPITRELKDVLTLQQEIAGLIVTNLSLKLGAGSGGQTAAVNPQALELYLQGRQAWNLRTRPGFDRAEDLLSRALAIAPDFARAHAALADVWNTRGQASETLGRFEQRGAAEVGRIIAKAREALALDPDSAEAHTALGLALLQAWQLPEAERELRHAIALNPSFASAHQVLGRLREGQGFMEDALLALQRAADLDPLSPRIISNYAIMLNHAGRWREALAATDRALAIRSDDSQATFTKANALMHLGRVDEATTLVRRLESGYEMQSVIFAEAGLKSEAEAALAKMDPRLRLTSRIRALLALGRREAVLALLEPGSITVNSSANFLFEEKLDPIRGAPEFVRLIRVLGLAEADARAQAWRAAHPPEKGEGTK